MKATKPSQTAAQLHQDPDMDAFLKLLNDPWFRLNNLYSIVDKQGQKVLFKMNSSQAEFYKGLHFRNIVLKARQRGFSTLICLMALDRALFNLNFTSGIIAHALPEAQTLFKTKIKFAYENLPPAIKAIVPTTISDTTSSYDFNNGSSISVSTSFRSGTVNFLHISELGKIASKNPDKAREIKSGALEALPLRGVAIIESTAEGQAGMFYEYAQRALAIEDEGKDLRDQDWRMFFEPWFNNPEYATSHRATITTGMRNYFMQLEAQGITLTDEQKWWYVGKEADLGELMFREYPATPSECFQASVEGSYFSKQLSAARRDGRIGQVPHIPGIPVETWWDLGYNDATTIWFTQTIRNTIHVIDYYESNGNDLLHYRDHLQGLANQRGFSYGLCHFPHDMNVTELGSGISRLQRAQDLGMQGVVIPRTKSKETAIESARMLFAFCSFDKEHCDQGLKHLQNYRRSWDDRLGVFREKPLHDAASDGADSFLAIAQAHPLATEMYSMSAESRRGDRTIHEQVAAGAMENSAGQVINGSVGFTKPSFLGEQNRESYTVNDLAEDPYANV